MKIKHSRFVYGLVALSIILSACLPTMQNDNETSTIPFGPQVTLQEHQTQVFDALWTDIKENYIYYQTADVDWNAIHTKYVDRINSKLTSEEFNNLLKGLESDLPKNEFVVESRDERIANDIAETSTYGGIGAFVGFEEKEVPHVVILDVMPGSPAEKAGLQAHDSILAIDGDPVRLEEGLNVVDRVRGAAGSTVALTIATPGEKERDVKLTRAQLTGTGKLKTEQLSDTNVGYVLLPPSASANMMDDLLSELTNFSANKEFKGLILDLRISNAASDWPLDAMLTLFENGDIGEVYNRSGSQKLHIDGQDKFGSQKMPLILLVGENTRGLAEVFTAAMQSNSRATVIGSKTSGDIETLNGFLLPDGSQIFIASTSFHFPGGTNIGMEGITPEVQIDARWDQIILDQDPVIQAAVQALEVKP